MTRPQAVFLFVLACAIAIHLPSLRYGFALDDNGTILEHPGVRGPFSARALLLRDFWGEPFAVATIASWRPLVSLSLGLDWHLGRGAPWLFHATNWAGDALSNGAPILVLAAFAAMAIHVDVVPSVTGRAELLAMLFSLLAIDVALTPNATWRAYVGATAAVFAAMLCKESSLPIALLVPPLVLRAEGASQGRRALRFGALGAAARVTLVAARLVVHAPFRRMNDGALVENPLAGAAPIARLAGALDVVSRYFQAAISAADRCPDASDAGVVPSTHGLSARVGVGVTIVAALATLLAVS